MRDTKRLFAMLKKLGLRNEERAGLALQYSAGKTERTSELSDRQWNKMLADLQDMADGKGDHQRGDKLRKTILSMAHDLGWENRDGTIDMERVDHWCEKHGYLHKPLDSHNYSDLTRLVNQFTQVHKNHLGGVDIRLRPEAKP